MIEFKGRKVGKSLVLKTGILALLLTGGPGTVSGQELTRQRLDALARQYAPTSYDALREFLSLPNNAYFPDHVETNVTWCEKAFQARSFATRRLDTGGPPLLLAERRVPNATRTVLIYLQIDGQPVDPSKWHQESPYQPVLKERAQADAGADESEGGWRQIPWQRLHGAEIDPDWRIFARSASDAKGPVVMFLTALDALAGEGLTQTYDLKVIMDFEEELGSPHLPAAVERHREALAADMLIIFDGPRHVTNRPTLSFGARGIATLTLTVFGPRRPQHSGHFGNWAPNPALRLAQLLASMKDDVGRVVIPGFYDGVEIDDAARAILAEIPDDEAAIKRRLGIADTEQVAASYREATQYPALSILGLASGWTGQETRTIIPATATAELDIRLVPESDASRLIGLVRSHIEGRGYHVLDGREPTDQERAHHARILSMRHEVAYGAFRTPYDSEVGLWLRRALLRAFGEEPVRIRMSGGSIPISPFVVTLGVPAVSVPTANLDNNQHSPNENLRLGNYLEGVRTYLAVLTQPFEAGGIQP